jgi:hypothetical protein
MTESAVEGLWREGDYWAIRFRGHEARLGHAKGLGYMAVLLEQRIARSTTWLRTTNSGFTSASESGRTDHTLARALTAPRRTTAPFQLPSGQACLVDKRFSMLAPTCLCLWRGG